MEQLTVSTPSFAEALESYIKDIQGAIDRDFETNYPRLYNTEMHPKIGMERGKRWVKLFKNDPSSKPVFCFIDPETGDIYKPANWASPAKGIRGNIYSETRPLTSGELYR